MKRSGIAEDHKEHDWDTSDSPPPSAAYMRQWFGSDNHSAPSHYLNQCWGFVNWTLRNKLQWNFNQDTKLFIHENAYENIVCEMAALLSKAKWVKLSSKFDWSADTQRMATYDVSVRRTKRCVRQKYPSTIKCRVSPYLRLSDRYKNTTSFVTGKPLQAKSYF